MFKDFKAFALRGNVVDLAVGVIIGAAFGKIVTSLVNDVIMPPIGLALGEVDFSNLFITLKGARADTLQATQAAGAVTLNYGVFLNTVVQFVIIAAVTFMIVRWMERLHTKAAPGPTKTEELLTEIRDLLQEDAT